MNKLKVNRQEQLSYRYNLIFNRQKKKRKNLLAGINMDFGVFWNRKAEDRFIDKSLDNEFCLLTPKRQINDN